MKRIQLTTINPLPTFPRGRGFIAGLRSLQNMTIRKSTFFAAVLVCVLLLVQCASWAAAGGGTVIEVTKTPQGVRVQYASGGAFYVEELVQGRWVGRQWGFAASPNRSRRSWDTDAFEVWIRTRPGAPETPLPASWRWIGGAELPAPRPGSLHFAVELANQNLPIRIKVHTVLDGTPVFTRWLEISNGADGALALVRVFPWTGQLWAADAPIQLGYTVRSDYPWEGWFKWQELQPGANVIRQELGLAYYHPVFLLRNQAKSEYFFGQLAWPLNRVMEFQKDRGLRFKVGPTAVNALRVIAPGEAVATPAVHLGYTKGGFDGAVQAMHDHIRRSVLSPHPADRAYRVQCLMPEDQRMTVYRGKDYNEQNLKSFVDVMAAAGMELFLLDGPTWCANYGEWLTPNPQPFPRGLQPLVEHTHSRDMLFGLYAEPEGGRDGYTSPGSTTTIGPWRRTAVFQQHPEWFVPGKSTNYPAPVLNLSKPEAAAYMEAEVEGIIDHYKLDLYRHDFCMELQGQGSETWRDGFLESDYWRHYEAFYAIFDRMRARHPQLILQQASGGGSRLDLGTLAHFDEHATSDRTSTPEVYRMLSGLSVYLPPEVLVTPIGMAEPKHRLDFVTMLRSIYALGNTPVVFNSLVPRDMEALTPEVRAKFLHYSDLYKNFMRPVLGQTKVYHHAPVNATGGVESGDWFAMEFSSPDRSRGWAVIIRLAKSATDPFVFKPKGLDPAGRYEVTFDNTQERALFRASRLMRQGLSIRLTGEPASELLLFKMRPGR